MDFPRPFIRVYDILCLRSFAKEAMSRMTEAQLSRVDNLEVGRYGFGAVKWPGRDKAHKHSSYSLHGKPNTPYIPSVVKVQREYRYVQVYINRL